MCCGIKGLLVTDTFLRTNIQIIDIVNFNLLNA